MIKKTILTLSLVTLAGLGSFFYAKHLYKIEVPKPVYVNVPYEVPVYYKDSSGKEHAKIEAITIERDLYKNQLDSISKLLGIKSKEITRLNDIITHTNINISDSIIYMKPDSSMTFLTGDNYMNLSGTINPNKFNISLSLIDTLHTTSYTKNYLFKPSKTYLDISNANPYVKIDKGKSVIIKEKKPFITIGPYIGYEVLPKQHFSAGISIQKPLITIY